MSKTRIVSEKELQFTGITYVCLVTQITMGTDDLVYIVLGKEIILVLPV